MIYFFLFSRFLLQINYNFLFISLPNVLVPIFPTIFGYEEKYACVYLFRNQ